MWDWASAALMAVIIFSPFVVPSLLLEVGAVSPDAAATISVAAFAFMVGAVGAAWFCLADRR